MDSKLPPHAISNVTHNANHTISPTEGIITSICTSFEDLDGEYHGPRLESTCMVVSLLLLFCFYYTSH